ncbi:MAG: hypothetical protein ACRENH_08335 [Gemmatimonadaceae bacterium]
MSLFRSWVGGALTATYLVLAMYIAQDEVRNSHGGWINLRGFGTVLVTAPSQILLGPILEMLGVAEVNYADLDFADYSQIALHILVTASIVYLVGAGLQFLFWKGRNAVRRRHGD